MYIAMKVEDVTATLNLALKASGLDEARSSTGQLEEAKCVFVLPARGHCSSVDQTALPGLGSSAQVGTKEQKLLAQSKSRFTFSRHGSWQPEQKCLHDGHRRIVMSNSIVITVPHRLGAKEAKRRIAEQIELLRRNYIDKLAYSEANWNGDTANLRVVAFGQTATAQVFVLDDALRVEVQLPWILAALTGKIQGILKSNAEESLRIGHTPPKGLSRTEIDEKSARSSRSSH